MWGYFWGGLCLDFYRMNVDIVATSSNNLCLHESKESSRIMRKIREQKNGVQRPNLSRGLNLSCGSNFVVSTWICINFSRFKSALHWNRFLWDLRRGLNSLNSDTGTSQSPLSNMRRCAPGYWNMFNNSDRISHIYVYMFLLFKMFIYLFRLKRAWSLWRRWKK